jgi:hypothetical protein
MPIDFSPLQQIDPGGAFLQGRERARLEQDRNMLRQMQAEKMQFERENMLAQRDDRAALTADRRAKTEAAAQRQQFLTGLGAKMAEGGYKLDRPTLGQMLQFGMQTGEDSLIKLATEGMRALDEEAVYAREAERFGLPGAAAPAAGEPANALAAPAPAGITRDTVQNMLMSPSARIREQGKALGATLEKPEKPPSATSITEFNFAKTPEGGGFKGTYSDFLASKQSKPAQVNIRLPEQEKEERGARGKLLVKQYEGVSEAARIAGRTLPALQTQEQILDSGFKTGFGTDAQKAGASVLSALGVPEATKYATDAQAFVSAMNQAVLQRQLEQKGPQTEADAQRITQTGAQLGNTPDANKFIVSVAKAQLKRDIDQRNFYDSWWKKNGTYDGAEDAWVTGPGGKSLFDAPELKRYAAQAKPTAAPTAPSGVQPYTDAEKERRYQEWKRKQGQP